MTDKLDNLAGQNELLQYCKQLLTYISHNSTLFTQKKIQFRSRITMESFDSVHTLIPSDITCNDEIGNRVDEIESRKKELANELRKEQLLKERKREELKNSLEHENEQFDKSTTSSTDDQGPTEAMLDDSTHRRRSLADDSTHGWRENQFRRIPSSRSINSSYHRRGSIASTMSEYSEVEEWEDKYNKTREEKKKAQVIQLLRMSKRSNNDYVTIVFEQQQRKDRWLRSLRDLDPRYQILTYYEEVARQAGPLEDPLAPQPPSLLRGFMKGAAFTVWRFTSADAIRKMIRGEVTGKGLDVKGKSAKTGKLSGLVPYLQIHENADKKKVLRPPADASIRIYFKSSRLRDKACKILNSTMLDMHTRSKDAEARLSKDDYLDDEERESDLKLLSLKVNNPSILILDENGFGLEVPERVFFDVFITNQNISRCGYNYETGRPSEPAFQDMNAMCVRGKHYKGYGPRAVIFQTSETRALLPQSLVIAYEENGTVTKVASDFDCFTIGTRGVTYDQPLPDNQVEKLKSLVDNIETVLEKPCAQNWTQRWLDILKKSSRNESAGKADIKSVMPEYGYGDPKSYEIMKGAVARFAHNKNGAVRHGAECFNYSFPQEIDEHFLVISDDLDQPVAWKYVKVDELQHIICTRIDEGFCCPLNPKWILADKGWKRVYDKMMASTSNGVQESLNTWYPPESGIRERIEAVHSKFPNGFESISVPQDDGDQMEGMDAMNLSLDELRRYLVLRRVRMKIRVAMMFSTYGGKVLRTRKDILSDQYNSQEQKEEINGANAATSKSANGGDDCSEVASNGNESTLRYSNCTIEREKGFLRRVRTKIRGSRMLRTNGGKVLRSSSTILLDQYNSQEKKDVMNGANPATSKKRQRWGLRRGLKCK